MVTKHALLIEVPSIQTYVFSSNKLKENIGASFIIEHLLYGRDGVLDETIKNNFEDCFDIDNWKTALPDDTLRITVGYIGGGNALLLFNNYEDIMPFISMFSKTCLIKYPTLRLVFGTKENFVFSDKSYYQEFIELSKDLQRNKSSNFQITSTPKYGITADCPWSNENAETFESASKNLISVSSAAKLSANIKSKTALSRLYSIPEKYALTDDIDKLGQPIEASYIAIVHIDGNGMGSIFSKVNSLNELRKKSVAVSSKAVQAMKALIVHIIDLIENKTIDGLREHKIGDKIILPIRPILVGGDDITFIAEGRIGIYLAEKFIQFFFDDEQRKSSDENRLMDGACAGVAIVKTHFPFSKGVQLAEELCSEAKKSSRESSGSKCFISYYYSATTFSGELSILRNKTHKVVMGNVYYGPYSLFDDNDPKSYRKLLEGVKMFSNPKKWPKNKVMRLREVLTGTANENELFETEMKDIGIKLPVYANNTIWNERETPYFDQIELMEFYLPELLND